MKLFLIIMSWAIIAFGQPAWVWQLGPLAAAISLALFFSQTFSMPSKKRFWFGTFWFTSVQFVQLSWFLSHPYLYIYLVYFIISFFMGLQFGILTLFVDRKILTSYVKIISAAFLWILLEWVRLFILSGLSFNPIGLSLTSTIYGLQGASLFGVYGLSFLMVLTNLILIRFWIEKRLVLLLAWASLVLTPYIYGFFHIQYHDKAIKKDIQNGRVLNVVLLQTAFPAEEALGLTSLADMVDYVLDEWKKILKISSKQTNQKHDLIVLPELVVPFGTYTFIYPYDEVEKIFAEAFGEEVVNQLPPLELPLARFVKTENGKKAFVNNAYFAQAISEVMKAPILLGLEDVDEDDSGMRTYVSSAIYIKPKHFRKIEEIRKSLFLSGYYSERYEKRVLVPLGEYIPFSFLSSLAKAYGVQGSFEHGKQAKVMHCKDVPFGISICYEETFGNIIRENKLAGAEFLVNLTSDVWYPDSLLPKQHFDHARLRAVELGVPMARSCNTGITCAVDSLGCLVYQLGDDVISLQSLSDSISVDVPLHSYRTLYELTGDSLLIGIAVIYLFVCLCFFWLSH